MKRLHFAALLMSLVACPSQAAEGMISVESAHGVEETADRLEGVLNDRGMTVFRRISHSGGAETVGIELRDTVLVIFGNPKVGSPLMKCQQSVAIDLPQKALIWKDQEDRVWLSYNDPAYLKKRHGISGCEEVLSKIEKALAGISRTATMQ